MDTTREKILDKIKYQVENQLKYAAWGISSVDDGSDFTSIDERDEWGIGRVRVTPHDPRSATPYADVVSPVSISDITQANPGVVTLASPIGIISGDVVYINGIDDGSMTELNDRFFYVKNYDINAQTLELINPANGKGGTAVDTSNYTSFKGGSGTDSFIYPQYGWCWDKDTYNDKYVAKCYAKFDDSANNPIKINEIGFYSNSSGNNLQARLVPTIISTQGYDLSIKPLAVEMYIEVSADYTYE